MCCFLNLQMEHIFFFKLINAINTTCVSVLYVWFFARCAFSDRADYRGGDRLARAGSAVVVTLKPGLAKLSRISIE